MRQRNPRLGTAAVADMLARIPNMFDSQPVVLDLLADGRLLWNDEVQELVANHFSLTDTIISATFTTQRALGTAKNERLGGRGRGGRLRGLGRRAAPRGSP